MKYRVSLVLYAGIWMMIILMAFVMQVIPLLLIITMINMSLGVTSPVALIALPAALFGAIVLVCMKAERRRKAWRPVPVQAAAQRLQVTPMENDNGMRLTEMRRRWLY